MSGTRQNAQLDEAQQAVLAQQAAAENFMRLQQYQSEYLAWLEVSEKKAGMDRYVYKKIR